MIGLLLRILTRLGLRWVVVAAVARFVARRFGRSTVQRATEDLEAKVQARLPAPLATMVTALPTEAKRIGGSAVIAGRVAKGAVITTRRAGAMATLTTRRATARADSMRGIVDGFKAETEASGRRLRSRYLGATVGSDAATDALLDTRTDGPMGFEGADPHDQVPGPVSVGRLRAGGGRKRTVNRVRRGYRPSPKPWD